MMFDTQQTSIAMNLMKQYKCNLLRVNEVIYDLFAAICDCMRHDATD